MNQQPSSNPLVCLGDGHDGIWNIFAQIADAEKRQEILDWYHLVENLGKERYVDINCYMLVSN